MVCRPIPIARVTTILCGAILQRPTVGVCAHPFCSCYPFQITKWGAQPHPVNRKGDLLANSPKNRLVKTCRYHYLHLILTRKIAKWINQLNHSGKKPYCLHLKRAKIPGLKKKIHYRLYYIFLYSLL